MRLLLLAIILTAGCVSTHPTDLPGPAGPDGPTAEAATLAWAGCEQWHLHFDARAEDVQGDVPERFTVSADENGLTTLLIHATFCENVQEALIAVPVVAPPEHEDPDRSEVAVVQAFHAGHGPTLYPTPFHARLVEASFERSDGPAGPTLAITGGGETTRLVVTLAESSGPFGGEMWTRFSEDETGLGVVTADGSESTNLGFGPVAYAHEGPGGAPPATAGIAHLVTGLDIEFRMEVRT